MGVEEQLEPADDRFVPADRLGIERAVGVGAPEVQDVIEVGHGRVAAVGAEPVHLTGQQRGFGDGGGFGCAVADHVPVTFPVRAAIIYAPVVAFLEYIPILKVLLNAT